MANNLDRLFREGLDQFEATPATTSWQQVQSQIDSRKKRAWLPLSIAAAITFLVTSTIIVMNDQKQTIHSEGSLTNIDYPKPELAPGNIDLPSIMINQKKIAVPTKNITHGIAKTIVKKEPVTQPIQHEMIRLIAIQDYQVGQVPESTFHYNFDIIKVEKPSVKITYIAENQPTEKKNKLNEFINSISKDASPIEILADIRDAKDQIFSRN